MNSSKHANPLGDNAIASDLGLYLHIPFCVKRCHFCAFYLVTQKENRIQRFVSALENEIMLYSRALANIGQSVSTVYLGGGTPTTLSAAQLSNILALVAKNFSLNKSCEVTVEATPESLTPKYLDTLLEAGVNRLSVGIQTFEPSERECLGISSTIEEAIRGIRLVPPAGFMNFNIDLIYGIPGQTIFSWERSLRQACEYEPTHLSCYALSVEEETRFELAVRRGELKLIETDYERRLQHLAIRQLECLGFSRYEISNWAKSGWQCRHNRRYWQGENYLGFGPSAQSYMDGYRFGNVSHLEQYARNLEKGELPIADREALSIIQQDKERVVFGLRLLEGVPIHRVDVLQHDSGWAESFSSLIKEKYIVKTSKRVALTAKGRQFADDVGCQLL